MLTKDLDGTERFDLSFAYDPASRLIRVEEPDPFAPGSTRLLKELFYARKNDGNDKRQGKLYQARRRNWVQPVSPLPLLPFDLEGVVTETFRYAASYDVTNNLTQFELEMRAYQLTHALFRSANEVFDTGCRGCTLGRDRRLQADVDRAIKRILADPNGAYQVTPGNPGSRQFPLWQ